MEGDRIHPPPPPVNLPVQRWSGPWRVLPATRGPETQGPGSSWAPVPLRSTLEPKGHLSEDTSMNSSLPFIPRATTQRQRGDLKTLLEQMGKSPCSWSQKLVSICWRPATWSALPAGRMPSGVAWPLGKASVCARLRGGLSGWTTGGQIPAIGGGFFMSVSASVKWGRPRCLPSRAAV